MPISREELENTLKTAFPNGEITVNDLAGDNEHWSVIIKDAGFAGLPRVAQHKKVQEAVKNHDIHALQIKTEA
ncbi:MAG: BolA family transcriptional regulator [Alphaproteobacteria bacterium CG11_big_fil_rev_8_21_14_0_20_44_7]|nr:MAG: BolA family transcriptional regulator [Alphaproteobacteria bacterium CG11_big_fil_rev_8_21_14_0_20_44_7]